MKKLPEETEDVPPYAIDILVMLVAVQMGAAAICLALVFAWARHSAVAIEGILKAAAYARGEDLRLPASTRVRAVLPGAARMLEAGVVERPAVEKCQHSTEPAQLLATLDEHPHRLIIGHTRGGKTTLMHEMATGWARQGARVLVCDPDASPGQWPGCRVVGGGDNFAAIEHGLQLAAREVSRRRALRAEGQRQFKPVHLVIDEAQDIVSEVPQALHVIEDVARRGAKLGIHLTVGVQDKQVATLGLQGKSELLRNFVVADIFRDRRGRRMAQMKDPTGEKVTLPIPRLTDPETLIKVRAGTQTALNDDALLAQMLGVSSVSKASERQDTGAGVSVSVSPATRHRHGHGGVSRGVSVDTGGNGVTVNVSAQALAGRSLLGRQGRGRNIHARRVRSAQQRAQTHKRELRAAYAARKTAGSSFRQAYKELGGTSEEVRRWWHETGGEV